MNRVTFQNGKKQYESKQIAFFQILKRLNYYRSGKYNKSHCMNIKQKEKSMCFYRNLCDTKKLKYT